MPKLPKNLPPLPPVPEGFTGWEPRGWGWEGTAERYGYAVRGGEDWYFGNHGTAGDAGFFYIVAVRDPKPTSLPKAIRDELAKCRPVEECVAELKKLAPKKREGRVVAVRLWRAPNGNLFVSKAHAFNSEQWKAHELQPVDCLPADAASVELMVEQAAQGAYEALSQTPKPRWRKASPGIRDGCRDIARAALAAIGITAEGGGRHAR